MKKRKLALFSLFSIFAVALTTTTISKQESISVNDESLLSSSYSQMNFALEPTATHGTKDFYKLDDLKSALNDGTIDRFNLGELGWVADSTGNNFYSALTHEQLISLLDTDIFADIYQYLSAFNIAHDNILNDGDTVFFIPYYDDNGNVWAYYEIKIGGWDPEDAIFNEQAFDTESPGFLIDWLSFNMVGSADDCFNLNNITHNGYQLKDYTEGVSATSFLNIGNGIYALETSDGRYPYLSNYFQRERWGNFQHPYIGIGISTSWWSEESQSYDMTKLLTWFGNQASGKATDFEPICNNFYADEIEGEFTLPSYQFDAFNASGDQIVISQQTINSYKYFDALKNLTTFSRNFKGRSLNDVVSDLNANKYDYFKMVDGGSQIDNENCGNLCLYGGSYDLMDRIYELRINSLPSEIDDSKAFDIAIPYYDADGNVFAYIKIKLATESVAESLFNDFSAVNLQSYQLEYFPLDISFNYKITNDFYYNINDFDAVENNDFKPLGTTGFYYFKRLVPGEDDMGSEDSIYYTDGYNGYEEAVGSKCYSTSTIGVDWSLNSPIDANYELRTILEIKMDNLPLFINNNIIDSEITSDWIYPEALEPLEVAGLKKLYDRVYPNFDTSNYYIPVSVDSPKSTAEILSYIHAEDDTDGNITSRVQLVSTTYDPEDLAIDNYAFNVSVADEAGNTTTATFYVQVYDDVAPTISACDYTSFTSGKVEIGLSTVGSFASTGLTTLKPLLTITDNFNEKADCTLHFKSNNAVITAESVLGNYDITVYATDASGNVSSDFVISATVVDDKKPVITASDTNQTYETALTTEQLIALFTCVDDTVLNKELTVDNYSTSHTVLGAHEITLKATDVRGNYETKTIKINVIDQKKPVITASNVNQTYATKLEESNLLDLFTVEDHSECTTEITQNTYTATWNQLGSKTITVKATDASGNYEIKTITIMVVDAVKPVIVSPYSIETGNKTKLALDTIKSRISVVDGYDGNLTYTITDNDNYSTNYQTVGTYNYTISSTDSSGNTQSATLKIVVKDNIAPNLWVEGDKVITIQKGQELTQELILDYLGKTQVIDVSTVKSVMFTPIDNEGTYDCAITFNNDAVQNFKIVSTTTQEEDDAVEHDFFSKEYWEDLWADYSNFNSWISFPYSWLQWLSLGVLGFILIGMIVLIIKKRK